MKRALQRLLDFAPLLLFAVVLAFFGLQSGKFLEPRNLVNIVVQASSTGIVAVGMTFVLLTAGVRQLRFSTDYREYFGPGNPQLQAFDEVQNVYTKNDYVLLMFEPKRGDIFAPMRSHAAAERTSMARSNGGRCKAVSHDIGVNSDCCNRVSSCERL